MYYAGPPQAAAPPRAKNREVTYCMRSLALRLLVLLLPWVAFSVLGVSREARAQATTGTTITVNTAGITRSSNSNRPNGLTNTDVGFADCTSNITLNIPLQINPPVSSYTLQVWAGIGQDCSQPESRGASTATCWQVAASSNTVTQSYNVDLHIQDLVSQYGGGTTKNPGNYTPHTDGSTCTAAAATGLAPQTVAVYFLYVDGGGAVQAQANINLQVSMSGPPALTGFSADEGDRVALVGWTLPTGTTSLIGVNVYCAPVDKVHSVTDAGSSTDGGGATDSGPVDAGSTLVCDGGFADGGFDDAGNPIDGGFVDGGCVSVPNDAGSGGNGGSCPTPSIDQLAVCATATGQTATQATVKGLVNGTDYVFAVAGIDRFGSAGALSNFACATPGPVSDFFHNYRDDGGLAGGCSLEDGPVGGGVLAGGLATLGIAFLRRRKGKRS